MVDKEIILATAGQDLDTIDQVVSFFKNRKKDFNIMHCVGEYPTQKVKLQINQVSLLKRRYPNIPIGFSTHEEPDNFNSVFLAIGQGADLFEKHIAVDTEEYPKNAYSSTPEQITKWLENKKMALQCSELKMKDMKFLQKNNQIYANLKAKECLLTKNLKKGSVITIDDLFYAWPSEDNQFVANEMSKYLNITLSKSLEENEPLMLTDVQVNDQRDKVIKIF